MKIGHKYIHLKFNHFFSHILLEKVESHKGYEYLKSNWIGQIFYYICGSNENFSHTPTRTPKQSELRIRIRKYSGLRTWI